MRPLYINAAYYLLVVSAGVSVALQQVLNAKLRAELGSPWSAGFVSYFIGLLAMPAPIIASGEPRLSGAMAPRTSWPSWTGGIFGAILYRHGDPDGAPSGRGDGSRADPRRSDAWAAGASFASGVFGAVVADLFPTRVRYSGVALAYNVSFTAFSGTAPLLATVAISATGAPTAPALVMVGCAGLALIGSLWIGQHGGKVGISSIRGGIAIGQARDLISSRD